jgi:YHS domain-containing protein
MRKIILFALVLSSIFTFAAEKKLLNVDKNGVAIQGYDPVAYFTDQRPVMGSSSYVSEYNGAKYQFASAEHKALFDKEPAKYEPVFGGFCAYGASQNHKAPIQPEAWQIRGGRLILNYDLDVRELFNKDPEGHLRQAEANWPGLVEKYGK